MPSGTHCDGGIKLRVGEEVSVGVVPEGDRLVMPMWGGSTTVHGRLVGIEWHEVSGDQIGPGMLVEDTDDFTHRADDYAYELTIATKDWLPHH
jgi:hypothetical protein